MKKTLRLLVIGGVAAGTKAASKARRDDPSMEITIITDEEYISYAGCGLAYYIGGVVEKRESLFARSPQAFKEKQNIDILLRRRAERIDTYDMKVHVVDLVTGEKKAMPYDRVLIATGAYAVIPAIEGIGLTGIFKLHTIPDADAIKDYIRSRNVKKAAVLGAGYIGVEIAENLSRLGIATTVFEAGDYALPRMFDREMADMLGDHIRSKGVELLTGTRVERFEGANGVLTAVIAGGKRFECDMAIIAAGVKPNVSLARDAHIALGPTGAIRVDKHMETSVRGIYAAGDCAEAMHIVTGKPYWMPLGSTANKMGRVAGAAIAGKKKVYPGIAGTAIVKVFDLAAGRTGLTEKEAKDAGFNPVSATVTSPDRPGYYPGGGKVTLKLTVDRGSRKLLGAQAVGNGIVDKIIDTAAVALTGALTVDDIPSLDLSYSPPYSTTLGALIVAGQVIEEKL